MTMSENPKRVIKAIFANEIVRVRRLCRVMEGVPRRFHLPPHTDCYSPHRQLALFLDAIGFDVRRIERIEYHPVWNVNLRRGDVPEGQETFAADVALSEFLNARGEHCSRREVQSMVVGGRITASIIWNCGRPGWLGYYKGKEERGFWNSTRERRHKRGMDIGRNQARVQRRSRGAPQRANQLRFRF